MITKKKGDNKMAKIVHAVEFSTSEIEALTTAVRVLEDLKETMTNYNCNSIVNLSTSEGYFIDDHIGATADFLASLAFDDFILE